MLGRLDGGLGRDLGGRAGTQDLVSCPSHYSSSHLDQGGRLHRRRRSRSSRQRDGLSNPQGRVLGQSRLRDHVGSNGRGNHGGDSLGLLRMSQSRWLGRSHLSGSCGHCRHVQGADRCVSLDLDRRAQRDLGG